MIRAVFLSFDHGDCGDEVECRVERCEWSAPPRGHYYRLLSYPAACRRGTPINHFDPPQHVLAKAWAEGEDV